MENNRIEAASLTERKDGAASESPSALVRPGAVGGQLLPDVIKRRILDDYILNGRVGPGDLLPSEKQLSTIYGVSRPTVRSAIKSLHESGTLSVRNGVGAMVLSLRRETFYWLDNLASIDTFAMETGHTVSTARLKWEVVPADVELSRKLRIPADEPVLLCSRLKIVDDEPAAWIIDALPAALVDVDDIQAKFRGSVLDYLLESRSQTTDYADCEVLPIQCDQQTADLLSLPVDAQLLYLDTRVVDKRSSPIVWGRVWVNSTKFRFVFRRRQFR
jgi:DNA-binding GntR family transcriptional regulator